MTSTQPDSPSVTVTSPPGPLQGDPGAVGLPTVIAGAVGLGLGSAGYLPHGALDATLAILMAATSIALLVATVWAAALGQNAAASLFVVFFGFYASYVAVVLGQAHGWYAGTPTSSDPLAAWLICWLVTIVVLTLVTLRMPWAFTLLLVLVDVALALLLTGTMSGSGGWTTSGAVAIFGFVVVATYLYADVMSRQTGGRGLPLGRPLLPLGGGRP